MDPFDRTVQDKVLAAVGGDRLSGWEALGRFEVDGRTPHDQAFLYPALHRLEATGRLKASWAIDGAGILRRLYARA